MGARPGPEPAPPIRFGTNGWRGVLAEDFTLSRLRRLVGAVATWLLEAGRGPRIVVAHDTRFLGDRIAAEAVEVLRARGAEPIVSDRAVPTPVAVHAIQRSSAAAALMVTASHNPPEYQGVKLFGPGGSAIGAADARRIEAFAAAEDDPPTAGAGASAPPRDLVTPYIEALSGQLDRAALERSGLRVIYDAMHGAGAGVLDRALEESGVRTRVRRRDPDPRFGGSPPDPTPPRLRALSETVGEMRGLRLGLATDGDADRFAAVDADGRVLSETEAVAVLVDHLARTGRLSRGVAISTATGSLVERVANGHGLRVSRHPIGFKHLSGALASGDADAAGEESGGFALEAFGRDKDGILAGCLLAELVAQTGAPVGDRLRELEEAHGRWLCGRLAIPADAAVAERLAALCQAPPKTADACEVVEVCTGDGLRLTLPDGFLMLRSSGTEPVLRVYAEAPGERALRRRLDAGARLLLSPDGPAGAPMDVSGAAR